MSVGSVGGNRLPTLEEDPPVGIDNFTDRYLGMNADELVIELSVAAVREDRYKLDALFSSMRKRGQKIMESVHNILSAYLQGHPNAKVKAVRYRLEQEIYRNYQQQLNQQSET